MIQPQVSFVIPTRNRAELLERAVRSILAQKSDSGGIEILVIDNQSTDGTAERIASIRRGTSTRIIHLLTKQNGGPARSRNQGAALAQGRYLAFVDSDVELLPGWLENMLAPLRSDSAVGMVAGKLLFASDPSITYSLGGELSAIGLGWDAHQGEPAAKLKRPVDKLWAPSAALMLRTALFRSLGGFDDAFFYGYEDSDFGWRLTLAGWVCRCEPSAVALHATTDQIDNQVRKIGSEIVYHYSKNRIRSMLKNAGFGWLLAYLPLSIGYSVVDSVLRVPRSARASALLWNLRHLRETMRLRREVQAQRKASDRQISPLFARNWFAPQSLTARMEGNVHLHGLRRPGPLTKGVSI